ncbi:3789_t:CDS:2 [Paraglomus brasilianum]|uniref:3789_t:CDS:1 n=1 Tax=Paraglomus brasilianum TaxID=144538 RepID=A0A9N9BKK7_9GLOM|nr:3789_t:CDS:2 [Paraglomus brasilianum]
MSSIFNSLLRIGDRSKTPIKQNTFVCPALDELIQSTKTLDNGEPTLQGYRLKWIPYTDFTEPKQIRDHAFQTPASDAMGPSKMSSSNFSSTPTMSLTPIVDIEIPEKLSARIKDDLPTWHDAMLIPLDGISNQTSDSYYDEEEFMNGDSKQTILALPDDIPI